MDRYEYLNTVVFSPEKHNQVSMAARNKTAVKVLNARRKISLTDDKTFDIIISRESQIDVTDVTFPHIAPKSCSALTIAEIKTLPPHQKISTLPAAVYSIAPSSSMANVWGTALECKTCYVADSTACMELTLWDRHIELVPDNLSYTFTNLTTKKHNGNLTLTTTRQSTITPMKTPISTTANKMIPHTISLNHLTSPIEGAAIRVLKLCPKCQTPQFDLSAKSPFHRCQSCKILRKGCSYLTKVNGTLTFMMGNEEQSLSITNSVLGRFLRGECKLDEMDNQDIEEFIFSAGPLAVQYTPENEITCISRVNEIDHQEEKAIEDSDEEMLAAADFPFNVLPLSKRQKLECPAPASTASPPASTASPPASTASPPASTASPPASTASPPASTASPPASTASPPASTASPPASTAFPVYKEQKKSFSSRKKKTTQEKSTDATVFCADVAGNNTNDFEDVLLS
ncbi:hypothetical protein R3I93_011917 [Phoxinus phoxinus]|uniref:Uncharacterized protein n=1 Tax=Phoxinus phoxinus TaxID=58324 RepID=A0AAN9D019_9TELE